MKIAIPEFVREKLEHMRYGIVGSHSAVEICAWTKKALRGKGVCYKQKFYGIHCHRCAQMSPAAVWCQQNCVFCWRPMEFMKNIRMRKEEVDPPQKIIEEVVKQRKRLLSGIGGAYDVNLKLWKESFELFPSHWAISLSGEPTLYPLLPELVKELKKRKEVKSIFIVTNGQEPRMLEKLWKENALPHQLYISLDAPNKTLFKKINRPPYKDGWERLSKTLSLVAKIPTRRVIRFTVIKGLNDDEKYLPAYAKLFEKSKADFIEVKAYMWLGYSRKRLKIENMPRHHEIKKLSENLLKFLPNYEYMDEQEESRIVVLKRKDSKFERWIIFENFRNI